MIKFDEGVALNVAGIRDYLLKKKPRVGVGRLRLPYTAEQVNDFLLAACQAEVAFRGCTWQASERYLAHIRDVAGWLTRKSGPTFGLFLCGSTGNGKTTLMRAVNAMWHFVNSDASVGFDGASEPTGFVIVTAQELVRLTKAYNAPTTQNKELCASYQRLRDMAILGIDDLGTEARTSTLYGEYLNAVMDIISYRYDRQFSTVATSNLSPREIKQYYDERFADRLREMMHIVNFGDDGSFRVHDDERAVKR